MAEWLAKPIEIFCKLACEKMRRRRSEAIGARSCDEFDRSRRLLVRYNMSIWRDGRVVEGARLESVYSSNAIAGSNPVLSARRNVPVI